MNNFFKMLIKFVISLVPLYFLQQFIHEFGHGAVAVILGGKIEHINFSINGGYVNSTIPNLPYVYTLVGVSGGLIASVFLLLIYFITKNYWVEFNILNISFLLTNLLTGVIEGFYYDEYVFYLSSWSYTILPFLLISTLLFRHKLNEAYPKIST